MGSSPQKRGRALSLAGQGELGERKREGGHPGRGEGRTGGMRLKAWVWGRGNSKGTEFWETVREILGRVSEFSR